MHQHLLQERHRVDLRHPDQRPGPDLRGCGSDGHVGLVLHGRRGQLQHQHQLKPAGHRAAGGPGPGHAVQPDEGAGHLRRHRLQPGVRRSLAAVRRRRDQTPPPDVPEAADGPAGVPGGGRPRLRGGRWPLPALRHQGQLHGSVQEARDPVQTERLHLDELRRERGRCGRGSVRPHHRHPLRGRHRAHLSDHTKGEALPAGEEEAGGGEAAGPEQPSESATEGRHHLRVRRPKGQLPPGTTARKRGARGTNEVLTCRAAERVRTFPAAEPRTHPDRKE